MSTPRTTADDHDAWRRHGAQPATVVDDLTAAGTLVRAWSARWAAHPDRVVLADLQGRTLTAADLDRATAAAAGALAAAGAGPGRRVLVSAAPSVAGAISHIAALRLGATVVPMNTSYQAGEVAHIVGDAQPTVAVIDDPERAGWVLAANPAVTVVDPVALGSPAVAMAGLDEPPALDQAHPHDPAVVMYTSGTTGRPKGAVLTHRNLLASAAAVRLAWRWTPDDRLLLALPLFHAHGLCVGLHGTLLAGASAVIADRFDADRTLAALVEHGCTLFFGVPTMYARLVRAPEAAALGRLRLCVAGSAPLAPDLFAAVAELSGSEVLERYGMTETVMLVSNPYDGERRPGSVGLPLPGVEVRLGTGDELLVRGPNVFAGYWRNEAATADSFVDGWFRTGDIAAIAPDGYVTLVGRAKELIITGGYNVYPREVEEALGAVPGIAELAIGGIPSAEWGETVVAYVVPEPGAVVGLEALARAAEALAPYKRPRQVRQVAALPRNALGKVVRGDLAGLDHQPIAP